jgi:hypothetical protein
METGNNADSLKSQKRYFFTVNNTYFYLAEYFPSNWFLQACNLNEINFPKILSNN